MKRVLTAASLALLLSAPMAQAAATKAQAGDAITQAVIENNKAAAAGFEWRDTYKKLLQPAKEAYRKGDYDKAVKLAEEARFQARQALHQAELAQNAGPHF